MTTPPIIPPVIAGTRTKGTDGTKRTVWVAVGVTLFFVMAGAVAIYKAPRVVHPNTQDAYEAASTYVMEHYPGARKLADYERCEYSRTTTTNVWQVTMRVDGLNAFGGPARNDLLLEMRWTGERFNVAQAVNKEDVGKLGL